MACNILNKTFLFIYVYVTCHMSHIHRSSYGNFFCLNSKHVQLFFHFFTAEYIPKASRMIAHHMMIYGCSNPATLAPMWCVPT